MSRVRMVFGVAKWGVPRASGDEPNSEDGTECNI